jgi:hypothetical protein
MADSVVSVLRSRYISSADVTVLVQAGGSGSYTVADVAAATGFDKFAGWALVVVYRSAAAPTRMLLVRDPNSSASPATTVIGGLPSVVAGRRASIGVVAFEGDLGIIGDSLTANGSVLTNSENPADNVFNGSIALGLGGLPSMPNNFGVDIDRFDTTVPVRAGSLADRTAVTFTFSTDGDLVYLATIVLAVDLG